jgi:folate-dependent tRNA-U54 methylase TrmFO/GidA
MNVNFGLFPPLPVSAARRKRPERHTLFCDRALADLPPYAAATAP